MADMGLFIPFFMVSSQNRHFAGYIATLRAEPLKHGHNDNYFPSNKINNGIGKLRNASKV